MNELEDKAKALKEVTKSLALQLRALRRHLNVLLGLPTAGIITSKYQDPAPQRLRLKNNLFHSFALLLVVLMVVDVGRGKKELEDTGSNKIPPPTRLRILRRHLFVLLCLSYGGGCDLQLPAPPPGL